MRTLNAIEMQQVSGGAHGHWKNTGAGRAWNKFVDWVNSVTSTVNEDIGDLITLGQPGTNPACNALGNTLGLVGQVAGTENGGAAMGQAGSACNNAVNSVQHSLAQHPAPGTSVR
jgi:hypothetical protein